MCEIREYPLRVAFFFQAELSPYAPPIVGGSNQKSTRLDDVHAARLWPLTGPQQKAPGPIAQGSMARNPGSEYLSIAHGYRVHGLPMMDEAKQPEPIESELKESIASRIERREAEIALATKQEAERHAAVIKNMHRLRALRLSQTSKASASIRGAKARLAIRPKS